MDIYNHSCAKEFNTSLKNKTLWFTIFHLNSFANGYFIVVVYPYPINDLKSTSFLGSKYIISKIIEI